MAPLSRVLSGIILDHVHFGSHLNSSKKTIDVELEKKNFQHAQEALAAIFSTVIVDGNQIVSEAIKPMSASQKSSKFGGKLSNEDRIFLSKHAQEGSLSFQISKCTSSDCDHCRDKPLRSNYKTFFPTGKMPVPVLFKRSENGRILAVNVTEEKVSKEMEYGDVFLNTRYARKCFV